MNSWQMENFDPTAHRVDTHQFNAANSSLVSSTGDNADAELNALIAEQARQESFLQEHITNSTASLDAHATTNTQVFRDETNR